MEQQRTYWNLTGIERKRRRNSLWRELDALSIYETWVVKPEDIGMSARFLSREYRRIHSSSSDVKQFRCIQVAGGILCIRVDDKQRDKQCKSTWQDLNHAAK